jgi:hypothetical protein
MKLNNTNRKDFYTKIINACKTGDTEFVTSVIDSDLVKQITAATPRKMLKCASGYGHIKIVEDIFSSPHLKKHINYPIILKEVLKIAFQYGHTDVVKFLIPKLDIIGAYHNGLISSGMMDAVEKGQIELVKYFLDDCPIKNNTNKDELIGKVINTSCIYNQLEILKYTLERDEFHYLSEKNNLNNIFATAFNNSNMDILQYFIFELNIVKTSSMNNILQLNLNSNFEKVNNWFKIRDVSNSLEKELPINQEDVSIKKPKL